MGYDGTGGVHVGHDAGALRRLDVMPGTGRAWEMPEGVKKAWRDDGWRDCLLPADHAELKV